MTHPNRQLPGHLLHWRRHQAGPFRKSIRQEERVPLKPLLAKPDKIQFVSGLPKTRSGKIMRRILRKVAENELSSLGDTSTLLDPAVLEEIKAGRL